MKEIRKVILTNIKYSNREKYLSVCGLDQLKNFVSNGSMACYDALSAPKEFEVIIEADFEDIDDVLDKVKIKAEDELGLTIESFNLRY